MHIHVYIHSYIHTYVRTHVHTDKQTLFSAPDPVNIICEFQLEYLFVPNEEDKTLYLLLYMLPERGNGKERM